MLSNFTRRSLTTGGTSKREKPWTQWRIVVPRPRWSLPLIRLRLRWSKTKVVFTKVVFAPNKMIRTKVVFTSHMSIRHKVMFTDKTHTFVPCKRFGETGILMDNWKLFAKNIQD